MIIGEYGLLGFDRSTDAIEQGEKLKFFEYLGYYARLKNITTMLWDNGQHFDRTTLQWHDPELYAQIKSSWTTRSGTASTDQVFVAKSTTIAAKTIAVTLNGTTFTALRQNGTDLVRGTDYTISGDQLTLTTAALTRLVGSRAYGVNAQLSAVFSAGVPWRINIITYDTPLVQNSTGTTSSFTIPTTFRGDRLATMEAKYADGSNAGPQNWTPYKEFAATFLPNYSAGTIALTTDFFAEVNDGAGDAHPALLERRDGGLLRHQVRQHRHRHHRLTPPSHLRKGPGPVGGPGPSLRCHHLRKLSWVCALNTSVRASLAMSVRKSLSSSTSTPLAMSLE